MWDAWGGDAGFSWSRKIVNREKNVKKSLTQEDLFEEIKDILDDVINPVDTVIEIPDDEEITKGLRAEVTREQMYALIEHLQEAIEAMIDDEVEMEDEAGTESESPASEIEDMYKSDNEDEDKWDNEMQKCWTGYVQRGMKEKNGRMVPNCVPVEKAYDIEDKEEPKVKKSIWDGTFIK
jgi:hypothetical protein